MEKSNKEFDLLNSGMKMKELILGPDFLNPPLTE
jgi:hypothetical protein